MEETDLVKKCLRTSKPARRIGPRMFRKKSPSDESFLHFFCKSSESDRVFNHLHDSNSIFRARGINSEWVSGGTVMQKVHYFQGKTEEPPARDLILRNRELFYGTVLKREERRD